MTNTMRGVWGAITFFFVVWLIIMSYRQGQVDAKRGQWYIEKIQMSTTDSTDTRYELHFWKAVAGKLF
jgi:hypothetical protein